MKSSQKIKKRRKINMIYNANSLPVQVLILSDRNEMEQFILKRED